MKNKILIYLPSPDPVYIEHILEKTTSTFSIKYRITINMDNERTTKSILGRLNEAFINTCIRVMFLNVGLTHGIVIMEFKAKLFVTIIRDNRDSDGLFLGEWINKKIKILCIYLDNILRKTFILVNTNELMKTKRDRFNWHVIKYFIKFKAWSNLK